MPDKEVDEWVEEKLDNGVSPERLKKVMENTGKDPSVVDEVVNTEPSDDPFQDSEVRPEPDENIFSDSGNEEQGTDGETTKNVESGFSGFSQDEDGEENPDGRSLSDLREAVPPYSISLPELDLNRNTMVSVFLILLVGGGFLAHSTGFMYDVENEVRSTAGLHEGCPDVGVLIKSISSSDGTTHAEVNVARGEARVVLEVFDGGEKLGESRATVEGEEDMNVGAVGNRAVFRPVDCERFRSEKRY